MTKSIQCENCDREHTDADADTVPDGRNQIECDCGNIFVECASCGDYVSIMESAVGAGRKPIHRDCFDSGEVLREELS